MKTFTGQYVAQGDLNIFAVDEIPPGLTEAEKRGDGRYTLAHSETGHCHVMPSEHAHVYDADEFVSYIDVKKKSNVVHLRNFDTHDTVALNPGKYRISRQREYTAEGFRRAAD